MLSRLSSGSRPLASLSRDEALSLLENLAGMHLARENIPAMNGLILSEVEDEQQLLDCGIAAPAIVLRIVLKKLKQMRSDGVTSEWLKSDKETRTLPQMGDDERARFFQAARDGHAAALVELMSQFSVNADVVNEKGFTALQEAARFGQLGVCQLLLNHGATVDAVEPTSGTTALHIAARYGHDAIAQLLLDCGARVDAVTAGAFFFGEDIWGRTALHLAAQHGHLNVVRLLLHRKANASAKTKTTPLHRAAEAGHAEIVQLLLDFGAEIDAWTTLGATAASLATKKKHTQVLEVLERYQRKPAAAVTQQPAPTGSYTPPDPTR